MYNANNNVWTVRILKSDINEKHAKSLLDPELAATVGAIMSTPMSQGRLYEVRNLDSAWDLKQIVKTIAETGWNIRPEKFIKSTSRTSNNVLVFATSPPRQPDIRVTGTTRWLSIIVHEPPKPRKNAWDIAFSTHNAEAKGPMHWPGQTEQQYRSNSPQPAWMRARAMDESQHGGEPAWVHGGADEGNEAEQYDVTSDDELEQQALDTADAMNINVVQQGDTHNGRAAPATPIAPNSSYVPTSSYDAIRAEWRQRTEDNNAEMLRLSNLQKAQVEEMHKVVAKVEAVFEEKLAAICKDMMLAMEDVRQKFNAAQIENTAGFASLNATLAALGIQMARMETEGKRGAQDEAAGARTRQRTSIITDEMSGSTADAA